MATYTFILDESDWDQDVEIQLKQSMNEVEECLRATGTYESGGAASTCPRAPVRSQHARIHPDQQVVHTHEAISEEWRPSGLRLAVIGRQQSDQTGDVSAGGDAVDVRRECEQEQIILEHINHQHWENDIFRCLQGANPAMTQAFARKVQPEVSLHPQLQQDAARAVMTAMWPDVVHQLQSEISVHLPSPETSCMSPEPPSTACNAAGGPPECRAASPGCASPASICSQPLMDQVGPTDVLPNSALAALPPHTPQAAEQGQGGQHHVTKDSQRLSDLAPMDRTATIGSDLQRLFLHSRTGPTGLVKRHSDTAAVLGGPQATGQSRFRSPGEAIRSQSVTPGRPRWQRWIGVHARLAMADAGPKTAAADASAAPVPKRSFSTPRSLSRADAPMPLATDATALTLAGSLPTLSSAPCKDTLLLWPRGSSEDCGPRCIGAHAVENPSPRRQGSTAVNEGCAEGRLGGGDNARCGVILAGAAGLPPAYGRGLQLKAHSGAGIWKNDQRSFRTHPASACDPALTPTRSSQLPPTPQRTPRASPREAAKAVAGEHLIGAVATGDPAQAAAGAAHTIPTAPEAHYMASPRDAVAADAARRSQALREEFRKSLQSLQVPMLSGCDSSGEV